jgi:DNA-binding transcriptional MerR regulator
MRMQKRQFRIGELAKHLGVEKFVVRFWEKEFNLKPSRSEGGQRFYEEKDLERLQLIKTLLYDEGFTIAGAKKVLNEKSPNTRIIASKKTTLEEEQPSADEFKERLKRLKTQLIELHELL